MQNHLQVIVLKNNIPGIPQGQTTPWLDLVRTQAPHARIEIVSGAGHFTMIEAAAACNELIDGFIAR